MKLLFPLLTLLNQQPVIRSFCTRNIGKKALGVYQQYMQTCFNKERQKEHNKRKQALMDLYEKYTQSKALIKQRIKDNPYNLSPLEQEEREQEALEDLKNWYEVSKGKINQKYLSALQIITEQEKAMGIIEDDQIL